MTTRQWKKKCIQFQYMCQFWMGIEYYSVGYSVCILSTSPSSMCCSAELLSIFVYAEAAMHSAIQLTRYLRHMGTEGSSLLTSEQYTTAISMHLAIIAGCLLI